MIGFLCGCMSGRVTAHVSQGDVAAITTAIAAVDPHPIISIMPIYERQPVAGSIPVKMVEAGPIVNGKVQTKPIITYERIDRVSVQTSAERGGISGRSYLVAKRNGHWAIQSRSFWIR
jgi:hypothetical protein